MTVVDVLRAAQAAQREGKLLDAIGGFRTVALREPDSVPAIVGLADCLARCYDFEAVDALLEQRDRYRKLAVPSALHVLNAISRHDVVSAVRRATAHLERFGDLEAPTPRKRLLAMIENCRLSAQRVEALSGSRRLADFAAAATGEDLAEASSNLFSHPDWLDEADRLRRAGQVSAAVALFFENFDWIADDARIATVCQRLFSMAGIYNHFLYSHLGLSAFMNGNPGQEAFERYVAGLYRLRRTPEIVRRLFWAAPTPKLAVYRDLAAADQGLVLPQREQICGMPAPDAEQEAFAALKALRDAKVAAPFPIRWPRPPFRVAVCFSGQLRGFRRTVPVSLQALRSLGDVDVFVSTWSHPGKISTGRKDLHRLFSKETARFVLEQADDTVDYVDEVLPDLTRSVQRTPESEELTELFGAERVVVEEEEPFETLVATEFAGLSPALVPQMKMYFKIWAANQLMEEHAAKSGTTYDYVIRVRPDVHVWQIDAGEIAARCAGNAVAGSYLLEDGFGDQFAVGSPEAMKRYSSVWERLLEAGRVDYLPTASGFMAEKLLLRHIYSEGLDPLVLRNVRVGTLENFRLTDEDLARRLLAFPINPGGNERRRQLARFVSSQLTRDSQASMQTVELGRQLSEAADGHGTSTQPQTSGQSS